MVELVRTHAHPSRRTFTSATSNHFAGQVDEACLPRVRQRSGFGIADQGSGIRGYQAKPFEQQPRTVCAVAGAKQHAGKPTLATVGSWPRVCKNPKCDSRTFDSFRFSKENVPELHLGTPKTHRRSTQNQPTGFFTHPRPGPVSGLDDSSYPLADIRRLAGRAAPMRLDHVCHGSRCSDPSRGWPLKSRFNRYLDCAR